MTAKSTGERPMRLVDLFCGAGGMSLGFSEAGFEVAAAFDSWESALEVYRANQSHEAFLLDLSDVDLSIQKLKALSPEAVAGGPPCQDFSSAGHRTEGRRAGLTEAFAEIAAAVSPKLIVMENVQRAQSSQAYAYARTVLQKAGYLLFEQVLDASRCGVPQRRKRFFMVAARARCFPEAMDSRVRLKMAERPLTVREHLGSELGVEFYFHPPLNYIRRGVISIDEPAPTVRGAFSKKAPPGYRRHPRDAADPAEARGLTLRERARLQTFPKEWNWLEERLTQTALGLMVGNAVPPALARFVGECALEALDLCG